MRKYGVCGLTYAVLYLAYAFTSILSYFVTTHGTVTVTESKLGDIVGPKALEIPRYIMNRQIRTRASGRVLTYVKMALKPVVLTDEQELARKSGFEVALTKCHCDTFKDYSLIVAGFIDHQMQRA